MKHEMTAREFLRAYKRMCGAYPECEGCPLDGKNGCDILNPKVWEYIVDDVAEWAAAHPEETLEPLGDNIYYDPKHRIVPEEITRFFTFEVTYVDKGGRVWDDEKMRSWRKYVLPQWLKWICKGFADADDVKCIKVQQFITKCHEEEV